MIKILLLTALLLNSLSPCFAENAHSSSLLWQKIDLERELEARVRAVLVPSIKNGEYVVMASVEVDKDFFPTPEEDNKSQPKDGAGKKKSVILMDKIDKDPPEDYIVLSKLGLAVPAFPENFFKEDRDKKADAPAPAALPRPQINDLFKHLTSASVVVSLSDSLPVRTRNLISGLLKSLNLKLGKTQVNVEIKYVPFSEPVKTEAIEPQERTLFEWLGQMGTSGGIVVAALILGVFFLLLFNRYARLMKENQNSQKEAMAVASPQPMKDEDEEDDKDPGQVAGAQPASEGTPAIDKFKHLVATNVSEAASLVKEWIKDGSPEAKSCLNALSRELEVPELGALFNYLSNQERHDWQSLLNENFSSGELEKSIGIINQRVVGALIAPERLSDSDALDLLFRLGPKEAADLCEEEPALSAVFIQNLKPAHLNRILSHIPADKISEIMSQGLARKRITATDLERFKELATARLSNDERSPHIGKLITLLPSSPPSVESGLFRTLATQLDLTTFMDLAQKNLPAELAMRLNPTLTGVLLNGYTRAQKTEFLFIQNEERMNELLPVIAPTEKSREILKLDLEQLVKANPNGPSTDLREKVIRDFTKFGRAQFKNDKALTKLLVPDLLAWALTMNESYNETVKMLKAS